MKSLQNLIKELKIRFGEDWIHAKIEERDYPFDADIRLNDTDGWMITNELISNKHGMIYHKGKWATKKITELPQNIIKPSLTCHDKYAVFRNGRLLCYDLSSLIFYDGFQYLTSWQYKELTNKVEVGDYGVFYELIDLFDGIIISNLESIDANGRFKPKGYGFYFDHFKKIENPENVNLKELLK